MLEFNILKGQYLNRLDKNVVSADTTDLKAQFELTADFTGTITAWWRRSDASNTYTSTLAADGTCTIPAEALAATDKAVYGPYDHDVFVSISDTGRTTTSEYKLTVLRSAFSTDATPGTGGNPTAYEELVKQFDELKEDNTQFKTDMTEQQTEFESTVTENVDNIRYVVETETAPPIIEEASGAEITLEDSAYRQVRGLQLYGYSKQVQTTGAQLIPYPYYRKSSTVDGLSFVVNPDESIVVNGTCTSESYTAFLVSIQTNLNLANGSYYLTGCPSGGSTQTFYMQLHNYDGANGTKFDTGSGVQIDFQNAGGAYDVTIVIRSGYTANNLIFKPMLNAGTSALPWEPYSGGYASPSPDWAQPIHSVADEVNLLDESLFEQTGTAFKFIHIQTDAESVTVSANTPKTTGGSAYIQAIPGNVSSMEGISTSTNGVYAGQSRTISPSDGYITIGYFLNGIGDENINFSDYWIMVNAGDTALPYRPYGHNVTVRSQGANLVNPYNRNSASLSVTESGGMYHLNKGSGASALLAFSVDGFAHIFKKYSTLKTIVKIKTNAAGQGVVNDIYPDSFANNAQLNPSTTMYRIYTVSDGTVTVAKDIMVNAGSTSLPYIPYVAPSSALISLTDSLRGIPVSSGGTYTDESGQQWIADYIYRRQTDGKWCLWRNCGAIVYDGSDDEKWKQSSSVSYRFIIGGSTSPALSAAIASSFKVSTELTTNVGRFVINDGNNSRYFNSNQNSLEAWRSWLAENPQTVVYQLATPTIEELPEDVQAELNGLYTYNLHTDMWNNDGAYMNLKYVADTKTWINNKVAGLSTAMIENL